MKHTGIISGVAISVALALGGCASTSEPPNSLTQAREAFQTARSNPDVPRFAAAELNQAGRALDRVEQLWTGSSDAKVIEHEAYLAKQQARIATETAAARAARAAIEQADLERQSVIAQSRVSQARSEQHDAEAAQRIAELDRAKALEQADTSRKEALQQKQQTAQLREEAHRESTRAEALQAKSKQDIQQLEGQLEDMKAAQTSRGWVLTLGSDVLFDVGQAVLKPGAYRSLERIATFLQAHVDQSVVVEGYTDSTGSEQLNLDLSRRRAEAVMQALVSRNVEPSRVRTRAFGEAFPVASNDTAAGRQLNRRVELVLVGAEKVGAGR
jgi:outer membrane protein OmpA-like peptidoglycan-associated protein